MSKRGAATASLLDLPRVANVFFTSYVESTPKRIKIIDCFLVYMSLTALVQVVYCALVGTFPYNSFLAGLLACAGSFVMACSLRLQSNAANAGEFGFIAPERSFADYALCVIVLLLLCVSYVG